MDWTAFGVLFPVWLAMLLTTFYMGYECHTLEKEKEVAENGRAQAFQLYEGAMRELSDANRAVDRLAMKVDPKNPGAAITWAFGPREEFYSL